MSSCSASGGARWGGEASATGDGVALQIAAGAVLANFAELKDLHEQTPLLFAVLVPPLLYIEAWQVPKRELWRSIRPVLGLANGLVALTTVVIGYGLHALLLEILGDQPFGTMIRSH